MAYSIVNEGRFRHHGGGGNSAQGYSLPYWFADFGLSKSVLNNKGTLTLNMRDIFGTRIQGTYSETDAFIDQSSRNTNFRVVRVNFNYRFGQTDTSLFRRKNMKTNQAGSDMIEG